MKIFDTFTYFNEDMILDIRLNELNDFIHKFVIYQIEKNWYTWMWCYWDTNRDSN